MHATIEYSTDVEMYINVYSNIVNIYLDYAPHDENASIMMKQYCSKIHQNSSAQTCTWQSNVRELPFAYIIKHVRSLSEQKLAHNINANTMPSYSALL